jgi:hypothetical protein
MSNLNNEFADYWAYKIVPKLPPGFVNHPEVKKLCYELFVDILVNERGGKNGKK